MKLTKWHKGTDKPVRDGVYQREYATGVYYCKFKNGIWKYFSNKISVAYIETDNSIYQNLKWRGITKPK